MRNKSKVVELGDGTMKQEELLYKMCKVFIMQADDLKNRGGLSDDEYESLVKIKRQYIMENKHLEKEIVRG